ncbi:MAG: GtrA family protein [Clostridia bacterium]|nr:GtrA family protein [Deltaproteobacteria bacterium]
MNILEGHLTPTQRVWTAVAPTLLFAAYFAVGLLIYTIRYAFKGSYSDKEMESRPTTALTGMWLRLYFAWVMRPLWSTALKSGLPPNAITTLSMLLSTASGVSLAAGRFALGGWLYIFSGILDVLDGRLARTTGKATASGAALDSILDRYADAAVLVGLAWFYRGSWVLMASLVALVGSSLVPYIRAKAEASGVTMRDVGLMQRAERIIYLGASVALSPVVEVYFRPDNPRPMHWLAVGGIVLLAVSTQVTALQRFKFLLKSLSADVLSRSKWITTGRGSAFRNVFAAAVATTVDFVSVLLLVQFFPPPLATAVGCVVGAIVNFTMNRIWTFGSHDATLPQLRRYMFVSFTSALLNSGGVAVILLLPDIDYRIAWLIVRGAVFALWNYPLQRDYVFNVSREEAPQEVDLQVRRA